MNAQGAADVENRNDGAGAPAGTASDQAAPVAAPAPTPLRTPRRLALSGVPERIATPACSRAATGGLHQSADSLTNDQTDAHAHLHLSLLCRPSDKQDSKLSSGRTANP